MFERILVGVDSSPAGFEALRQARRLLAPGGRLVAVTVVTPELAVHAGFDATRIAAQLWAEAHEALAQAEEELADLPRAATRLVRGDPIPALLAAAHDERADLVVVGTHGGSRAAGIAFGSVVTALLHDAPCPVLVARPTGGLGFPQKIVVGIDGSPNAAQAERIARELGERLLVPVRVVAASGGKQLEFERLRDAVDVELDERHPVDALAAAGPGELLVVGSRGLHGLSALGSVSERVAHRARGSVLVVRQPAVPAERELATAASSHGADAEPPAATRN